MMAVQWQQQQQWVVDPAGTDGKGVGDDPIHVYCHMTTSLNKKITRLEKIFEKIIIALCPAVDFKQIHYYQFYDK